MASERKDVISLGVGEPDFITPWVIRDAGIRTVQKGYTQYTSNKGVLALREEISAYLKNRFNVDFSADDIVITVGASEAIDATLRAVVDEGDEVLVPDPAYVSYAPCISLAGGVPVPVETDGATGFKLTPEKSRKGYYRKDQSAYFSLSQQPYGRGYGKRVYTKTYTDNLKARPFDYNRRDICGTFLRGRAVYVGGVFSGIKRQGGAYKRFFQVLRDDWLARGVRLRAGGNYRGSA